MTRALRGDDTRPAAPPPRQTHETTRPVPAIARYIRRIYVAVARLRWTALAMLTLAHALLSWALLSAAGEGALTGEVPGFVYFYLVTATTVGYGDLSPVTEVGRLVAVFFVVPGGIAIFTALLGKILSGIAVLWRQRMNGLGSFAERSGHIVVLGWNGAPTRQLLEMLAGERGQGEPTPVLVAKGLEANPAPHHADYVRAERLSDPAALERAGLGSARAVIVQGQNDDETLAAALIAAEAAAGAHVVAHCEDERTAAALRRHHPGVEAIGSLSSELLVRAARDPGASVIASLLFTASTEDTAFSMPVPPLDRPLSYGQALAGLKRLHKATLVGLGHDGRVDLNCDEAEAVEEGHVLYYIADRRIAPEAVAWERLAG